MFWFTPKPTLCCWAASFLHFSMTETPVCPSVSQAVKTECSEKRARITAPSNAWTQSRHFSVHRSKTHRCWMSLRTGWTSRTCSVETHTRSLTQCLNIIQTPETTQHHFDTVGVEYNNNWIMLNNSPPMQVIHYSPCWQSELKTNIEYNMTRCIMLNAH